jgi:hypothetical protein
MFAVLAVTGCASRTPGRVIGGSLVGVGAWGVISAQTAVEPMTISGGIRQDLNETGGLLFLGTGLAVLLVNELREIEPPSAAEPPHVTAR